MTTRDQQLDWNSLKYFWVAAQQGSFSQAAKHLGVSQPTLSRQIQTLELALNVTLFERSSSGLYLTEAGQRLLQHTRPMASAADQVQLTALALHGELDGEVSLSVSESDALHYLSDLVPFLRHHAPAIQLTLQVSNQVSELKKREADIAIRSFRPTQADLITRKLYDEQIWFYGTPDHLARYDHAPPLAERHDLEIIGFERNTDLITRLVALGWPVSERNFPIVTHFQALQWALAKQGQGLVLMPQSVGDACAELERAFVEDGPVFTLPIWLVTHRELHTSPRIRRVFDLLGQWFEQQANRA
ncbi:HTH-type transcriptional activator CmpR [Marinomonas aquimarina]|uniref:HTH-type transcriptional activator CmpR n=1 Tax=Marinomonas aquimarina TaxID=295068 RepID=A0A1A8TM31_9GAMM|nr:LysR family transcriptional regulator [Marinomonas aquimarina]SBS34736.1 HTH-type transcriptional activator CmpR [Marinomonas aquimarina]